MSQVLYKSEEDLILSLRRGDNNALKHVYKTYWSMILRFILLNNGIREDAEEIYQEGIISLYEKVKDSNFSLSCSLKTYVYSICRNKWLSVLRGRKFVTDVEDYIENIGEETTEEDVLPQNEELVEAISNMGDPCKSLLIGFYYEKLSMEELSQNLNYSSANVAKQQKFRCIERLKKIFLTTTR